jgi:hypothetical protein
MGCFGSGKPLGFAQASPRASLKGLPLGFAQFFFLIF